MVTKLKELEKLTEEQQEEIQQEMERGYTKLEYTYPKARIKLRKPQKVWAHFLLALTGGIGNVVYALVNETQALRWDTERTIRSSMTPHQFFLTVVGVILGLAWFGLALSIVLAMVL